MVERTARFRPLFESAGFIEECFLLPIDVAAGLIMVVPGLVAPGFEEADFALALEAHALEGGRAQ